MAELGEAASDARIERLCGVFLRYARRARQLRALELAAWHLLERSKAEREEREAARSSETPAAADGGGAASGKPGRGGKRR